MHLLKPPNGNTKVMSDSSSDITQKPVNEIRPSATITVDQLHHKRKQAHNI